MKITDNIPMMNILIFHSILKNRVKNKYFEEKKTKEMIYFSPGPCHDTAITVGHCRATGDRVTASYCEYSDVFFYRLILYESLLLPFYFILFCLLL